MSLPSSTLDIKDIGRLGGRYDRRILQINSEYDGYVVCNMVRDRTTGARDYRQQVRMPREIFYGALGKKGFMTVGDVREYLRQGGYSADAGEGSKTAILAKDMITLEEFGRAYAGSLRNLELEVERIHDGDFVCRIHMINHDNYKSQRVLVPRGLTESFDMGTETGSATYATYLLKAFERRQSNKAG